MNNPHPLPLSRDVTRYLPLRPGVTCWRYTYGLVFNENGHAIAECDAEPGESLTWRVVAGRMGERWARVSCRGT